MMDAVEFLKERRRMCNAQDGCDTCPISIACGDYFVNHKYTRDNTNGMVATVEQWAKEHPAKTRQSEFLKHYPGARFFFRLSQCLPNGCIRRYRNQLQCATLH